LRRVRGLSQSELAKNFGKKQNTIGNWENGISEPSIKELVTLSQIFMVDMVSLVTKNLEHENDSADKPSIPEAADIESSPTSREKESDGFWLTLRELRRIQEKLDALIKIQGNSQRIG